MMKESKLQHDVAHLKLDPASREERASCIHRGRASLGDGNFYSEKGPARERGKSNKSALGRF